MITATFEILNLPNDQMVTSKVGRAGPTCDVTPICSGWLCAWCDEHRQSQPLGYHSGLDTWRSTRIPTMDAHLSGPMCCLPSNREHRESYIVIFIPLCRDVICSFSGSPTSQQLSRTISWPFSLALQKVPFCPGMSLASCRSTIPRGHPTTLMTRHGATVTPKQEM